MVPLLKLRYKIGFIVGVFISFAAMLPNGYFGAYFQIAEESKLSIAGSSNVNEFNCDCVQKFPKTALQMRLSEDGNNAVFDHAVLRIQTTKLDCKHKIMNRDMYKTLKAEEHPYITIVLKEAFELPRQPLVNQKSWTSLRAHVVITIAGKSKEKVLDIEAKKIDNNLFRFKSEQVLHMTDFGIDPPTAMLGLIKVDNTITIHLDLVVSITD